MSHTLSPQNPVVTVPRRDEQHACSVTVTPRTNPQACGRTAISQTTGICECGHIDTAFFCAHHLARMLGAGISCTNCRLSHSPCVPCHMSVLVLDMTDD